MIGLTENAAKELNTLVANKNLPQGTGLRLSVQKGGCAGMQYVMAVSKSQPNDQIFDRDGASLYLDSASSEYLEGCEIYYEYGLTDSGFKIRNPSAARSCGCGTSFEAKGEEGNYNPADDCK